MMNDIYTITNLVQAKAFTGKNVLVTLRVQLREPVTKLEFLALDTDGTIRALFSLHGILRQVVSIYAQEITNTSTFQFKIPGYTVMALHVNDVLLYPSENPCQHVVKMDPDIRCHASTLALVTFPARVIPVTARGDISQIHVVNFIFRSLV